MPKNTINFINYHRMGWMPHYPAETALSMVLRDDSGLFVVEGFRFYGLAFFRTIVPSEGPTKQVKDSTLRLLFLTAEQVIGVSAEPVLEGLSVVAKHEMKKRNSAAYGLRFGAL